MDNILISNPINIEYLSGFSGTHSFLLISDGQKYLFTDSRYYERAVKETRGVNLAPARMGRVKIRLIKDNWPEILLKYKIRDLGFEANSVSYSTYIEWKKKLKGVRLVPVQNFIEKMRQIKKPKEINAIRYAIKIAEGIVSRLKIKEGITEIELKSKIDCLIRDKSGAEPSFNTIVAFGVNSSMPHALPGNRKLLDSRIIKIDFGVRINGYCSDLTRTFWMGRITNQFEKIYNIVLTAQKLAIEGIRPGRRACDIDALARNYIKKNSYGRYFGHSLGHGIGMSIHELPRINYKNKEKLERGMIFSIEPGIYIPGWGGIRIEDLVLVTKTGCEVLTKSPKQLKDVIL